MTLSSEDAEVALVWVEAVGTPHAAHRHARVEREDVQVVFAFF
jgi:hypothetical protein